MCRAIWPRPHPTSSATSNFLKTTSINLRHYLCYYFTMFNSTCIVTPWLYQSTPLYVEFCHIYMPIPPQLLTSYVSATITRKLSVVVLYWRNSLQDWDLYFQEISWINTGTLYSSKCQQFIVLSQVMLNMCLVDSTSCRLVFQAQAAMQMKKGKENAQDDW